MIEPNPFPSIPITEDKILEQVGGRTFQRARTYAAKGMVVRYRYDAAANELHGLVKYMFASPDPKAPPIITSSRTAPAR